MAWQSWIKKYTWFIVKYFCIINFHVMEDIVKNDLAVVQDRFDREKNELIKVLDWYIEIAGFKIMKNNLRVAMWSEKLPLWKPEVFLDVNWIKYKESFSGDIWEYLDGDFQWEQLFTWYAARRESEKQWLRMLEYKEWEKIIAEIEWSLKIEQVKKTIKQLYIKYSWYGLNNMKFIQWWAHFWLLEKYSDCSARYLCFRDEKRIYERSYKVYCSSARCVVNE